MIDYPALAALTEVLRRGSFEAAASALNVTPSAISQRIRALEDRMGAVLVDRGPPVTGTETGHRLAAHLDQVRLLESTLPDRSDRPPVLRIAVNADSLASWVMPVLPSAPGFVDLVIDDQDHALDWLRSGQVIAAITSDSRPVTGCDSFPLGRMRYRATASVDFARKHFKGGVTAANLSTAPSLCFNAKDTLQSRWAQMATGQKITLPMHRIPSSQAFVEATRLGLGWAMNPEIMIREELASRRLMDLKSALPLDVPLYWQVSRITARAIAPLTEAIRKTARATLLS
ncbi:LysR family transcriptional regulator ArgP [Paracoccus caeni]|uniref:LysR family transcriptional regulator ArgP n=1 Tax=Paracoccus caeni TaxID=657651 RepID=A0A934SJ48_9RHOB|nr:LysR family transcriptional regulator ArgP [Paracoccus caeni]MBK4216079.1 LysR family transcriptional regulator ArgP [Paracoccus caeni]